MISKEIDNHLFETLLKLAVTQDHYHELASIPSEDELSGQYFVTPEFERKIRRLIRKEKYSHIPKLVGQYILKIAAGVAIILALTLGTILTVPEVRATVLNVIIEWFDTNTSYRFSESSETTVVLRPSYLPTGFHESSISQTGSMTTIIYKDIEDNSIYYICAPIHAGYSFAIDNEHSDHSQITINGIKADLYKAQTDQDSTHIIWQENQTSLHLMSTITYQELIKMAESIQIK